eukprot:gene8964-913_t
MQEKQNEKILDTKEEIIVEYPNVDGLNEVVDLKITNKTQNESSSSDLPNIDPNTIKETVKIANTIADKVANAKTAQCMIGAVLGYFTGYFTKKIGKNALVMVGGGSLAIASLNHFGYIKVDTKKLQEDLDPLVEQSKKLKVGKYYEIVKEYVKKNIFVAITFGIGGLLAL